MADVSLEDGQILYPHQRVFQERVTKYRFKTYMPKWIIKLVPTRTYSAFSSSLNTNATFSLLALHGAQLPLPTNFKFGLPNCMYDTSTRANAIIQFDYKTSEYYILTNEFAQNTGLSFTGAIARTAIYIALGLMREINNVPPGAPLLDHTPEPLTTEELLRLYKLYNPEGKSNHSYTLKKSHPRAYESVVLRP